MLRVTLTLLLAVFTLAINSCGPIPQKSSASTGFSPALQGDTALSRLVSPAMTAQAPHSGVYLLRDGGQALRERLHLADLAETSIDAQYYIWNSDKSGKLLMQRLLMAAERGVSVRLLLDDFSIGDRNDKLLTINSHPNLEVRIYNPFVVRTGVGKWFNFAFDFERLNRRMHNKIYLVDRQVAVTGGRNIGDEYFSNNDQLNFHDADILSIGPVVTEVASSFEKYWQSPWAVPIDLLIDTEHTEPEEDLLAHALQADLARPLQITLPTKPDELDPHFRNLFKELIWANSRFIADNPGGRDDQAYDGGPKRVALQILDLAAKSNHEILIESAYFVLSDEALELARQLTTRGVQIQALTNSMASNDVLPNHASYAKVREDMLENGIRLHELRPDAESCLLLLKSDRYCDEDSFLGLHTKAAVFDRKTVYVGSFNLNLRSAYLNTEAAMIIDSKELAEQLASQIELNMHLQNSWKVERVDGELEWITDDDGQEVRTGHDPRTTWMERFEAGIFSVLPGALYY